MRLEKSILQCTSCLPIHPRITLAVCALFSTPSTIFRHMSRTPFYAHLTLAVTAQAAYCSGMDTSLQSLQLCCLIVNGADGVLQFVKALIERVENPTLSYSGRSNSKQHRFTRNRCTAFVQHAQLLQGITMDLAISLLLSSLAVSAVIFSSPCRTM